MTALSEKEKKRILKNHPGFWVKQVEPLDGQLTTFPDSEEQYGGVPFTFIDLFAGIGGFRAGLEPLGGKCVFSSEWDKFSALTYKAWYGEDVETRDIRDPEVQAAIPDHDILCAGFPCQPFSLAGVSKNKSLNRGHGFDHEKQGNLFYALIDIIEAKQPSVLFLENVKNLLSHDKGKTWAVIQESLTDAGYRVFYKIIDAQGWVPQHRERIFIVAFHKEKCSLEPEFLFPWPQPPSSRPSLADILEKKPSTKYMLSDKLWNFLQDYKEKNRNPVEGKKKRGFGYGLIKYDDRDYKATRTISARYHKDGSEILLEEPGWRNPRRLTPREAALLQGFDNSTAALFAHTDGFPQATSDTQAYRQFGNAVVPKVINAVGENILTTWLQKSRASAPASRP